CDDCSKSSTHKSSLTSHHRVHTNEKPFTCTTCGKSFSCRSNLYQHRCTHASEQP
ncbi:ZFP41 protein, partial [Indicator maculatus]|nr:ZFP41 protein [Indicator maculatus]